MEFGRINEKRPGGKGHEAVKRLSLCAWSRRRSNWWTDAVEGKENGNGHKAKEAEKDGDSQPNLFE